MIVIRERINCFLANETEKLEDQVMKIIKSFHDIFNTLFGCIQTSFCGDECLNVELG